MAHEVGVGKLELAAVLQLLAPIYGIHFETLGQLLGVQHPGHPNTQKFPATLPCVQFGLEFAVHCICCGKGDAFCMG